MVLDTTWYKGQWWNFAEDAFGIDDNQWFDPTMQNPDTSTGWHSQQLYEIDPVTGQLRPRRRRSFLEWSWGVLGTRLVMERCRW